MNPTLPHATIMTLLTLTLFGCGSVESTSDAPQTEVLGVKHTQQEQNNSLTTQPRETNTSIIEPIVIAIETPPQQEENHTIITIAEPVIAEIVETEEPPEPIIIEEEEELDYTQAFINENQCQQILDKEFLQICYDHTLKVAKGVGYTLYGDLVNELNIKERPSFHVEEEIDKEYRATVSDYSGSGYDRGHMAPDAAFDWSQESLDATYSLANIIPQVPEVNQQMWVKAEKHARDIAIELGEVNILNIVKYRTSSPHIGESNITVSMGYYKMLFNENDDFEECFYYANDLNASSDGDTLESHKVDCTLVGY